MQNVESKAQYGSMGRKEEEKGAMAEWTGSLKKSHRIVIINREQAVVCNESCLI